MAVDSHNAKFNYADSTSAAGSEVSANKPVAKRTDKFSQRLAWLTVLIWVIVILAGMAFLTNYAFTAGATGVVPDKWPSASRISRGVKVPTLIMFVHPRCPCSRASLEELNWLVTRCQSKVDAQIWLVQPEGTTSDWSDSELRRKAVTIQGVTVHEDKDGVEAGRFQAQTSGATVLYDREGRLIFQGGITMMRGHMGGNPGLSAIISLLDDQNAETAHTPVFGCPLTEPVFNR